MHSSDYVDQYEETQAHSDIIDNIRDVDIPKVNYTLINEYWLHEIKSQDDAIRYLINSVSILLGVYFTLIITNLERVFGFHFESNITSAILVIEYILILTIPPLSWIFCLHKAMTALCPPLCSNDNDKESDLLLKNDESSTEFLINRTMKKHEIYGKSYSSFVGGLIMLIFILIIFIFVKILS